MLLGIQTKKVLFKISDTQMARLPHRPIRRARCCPRRRNRTALVLYGSRWSFAARWNLKTHCLWWKEEGLIVAGWVRRHWPRRWPSTGCCWKRKPKGSWKKVQISSIMIKIILNIYWLWLTFPAAFGGRPCTGNTERNTSSAPPQNHLDSGDDGPGREREGWERDDMVCYRSDVE